MFQDKPIFRENLPLLFIHIRLCKACLLQKHDRSGRFLGLLHLAISPALQVILYT